MKNANWNCIYESRIFLKRKSGVPVLGVERSVFFLQLAMIDYFKNLFLNMLIKRKKCKILELSIH